MPLVDYREVPQVKAILFDGTNANEIQSLSGGYAVYQRTDSPTIFALHDYNSGKVYGLIANSSWVVFRPVYLESVSWNFHEVVEDRRFQIDYVLETS